MKNTARTTILQELVEMLRIKVSMAIKLRMLCYLRTQGMCITSQSLGCVRERDNAATPQGLITSGHSVLGVTFHPEVL